MCDCGGISYGGAGIADGYCGQTQPHPAHIWAQGQMGIYTQCSGAS